jgi:hypothetical protein
MIRNIEQWIYAYVKGRFASLLQKKHEASHLVFCFADHFEPFWGNATKAQALQRVRNWVQRYPEIASKYSDSTGIHPKHTFFYPEEQYDSEVIELLAELYRNGFAEFEIHIHHNDDTSDNLRFKLLKFRDTLFEKHHLLSKNKKNGMVQYAFIHGNWAMNNSRKDGKLCGINDETTILQETGCYADFTMPSAPSETQTKKINSIYYSAGNPQKPKSHEAGVDVKVGISQHTGLLFIQGPLSLNWNHRKYGIFPRIENSSVDYTNPVTRDRIQLWVRHCPSLIANGQQWLFIKIHTHGCQESNMEYLLSNGLHELYALFQQYIKGPENLTLHYATPREMANLIVALETAPDSAPAEWRDFLFVANP